jgi:hypothetical protein
MSPFSVLITIFLIIIGIGGILYWLNSRLKHFFKIKSTHWLILMYAFILLAASVVAPFVSTKTTEFTVQGPQEEAETVVDELTEMVRNRQLEKIDEKYISAEHSFEGVEQQTLRLTSNLENWSHIYVDRKDVNDGKIEAVIYQPSLIIDGADFSEVLEPYEIKLEGDKLTIHSNQQAVNMAIMHSPFPVRQLTNVSMMHHSSSGGDQLIYLQIPRDLELEDAENLFVRYVE